MEGRGYELDELIRRSKTVSDSDSVKVFKKGSDTREAMWYVRVVSIAFHN
jgi:hypothetical protein